MEEKKMKNLLFLVVAFFALMQPVCASSTEEFECPENSVRCLVIEPIVVDVLERLSNISAQVFIEDTTYNVPWEGGMIPLPKNVLFKNSDLEVKVSFELNQGFTYRYIATGRVTIINSQGVANMEIIQLPGVAFVLSLRSIIPE